ncbi:hypothetical protein GQ53DRAFT_740822 [Thozetella sp. PMI_491]|nr:hypothetical protein GQ53DRAFT_740822 [Thozetella sp. PMI_491]
MGPAFEDGDSDYGYDLTAEEEALVSAAIERLSPTPAPPTAPDATSTPRTVGTAEIAPGITATIDSDEFDFDIAELGVPLPRGPEPERGPAGEAMGADPDVSYPDLTSALLDIPSAQRTKGQRKSSPKPADLSDQPPLVRFRTFPRKPFSVSDFTAGAWCEMQYHYVLTRLRGRRPRTKAMKAGTKVHEKLEDEVFTTVRVEVEKKEDGFGLKVWNIIQGLRTLRETGLTRELEVWGLVHGNVVNGIIDGLSYKNPDPEFEEEVRSSQSSQASLDPKQAQITSFFPSSAPRPSPPEPKRLVYITDVKTRASKTPPQGAQVRSTKIQLFLYHRFLSDMASDNLDYIRVFRRYGLDPDETFSDAFMAQIGALHDEVFVDASSVMQPPASSQDSGTSPQQSLEKSPASSPPPDLIRYETLRSLLGLLKSEIQLTFPDGAESIGPIVAVEYRMRASAEGEDGGAIIGENLFAVDSDILNAYLDQYMEWWKGEREARGVPLDESFKCRTCDFADDCEWRDAQDREILRQAREKQAKARESASATAW